jgi:hypothetical protein
MIFFVHSLNYLEYLFNKGLIEFKEQQKMLLWNKSEVSGSIILAYEEMPKLWE